MEREGSFHSKKPKGPCTPLRVQGYHKGSFKSSVEFRVLGACTQIVYILALKSSLRYLGLGIKVYTIWFMGP